MCTFYKATQLWALYLAYKISVANRSPLDWTFSRTLQPHMAINNQTIIYFQKRLQTNTLQSVIIWNFAWGKYSVEVLSKKLLQADSITVFSTNLQHWDALVLLTDKFINFVTGESQTKNLSFFTLWFTAFRTFTETDLVHSGLQSFAQVQSGWPCPSMSPHILFPLSPNSTNLSSNQDLTHWPSVNHI